jgi:tetratricopeptide (TPR) repeat protein
LAKDRAERHSNPESLSRELEEIVRSEYAILIDETPCSSHERQSDSLRSLVDAFVKLGDLERAREICIAPDYLPDTQKYIQLATIENHAHDYDLSIRYADKCLEAIDKENPEGSNVLRAIALNIKAQALTSLGRIQDGLHIQRQATEAAPEILVAWTNLGNLQRIAGDRRAALESYRRSLSIGYDPQTIEKFVTTAVVIGEFEAAQQEIVKALSVFGEDPRFCFLMAHVLVNKIAQNSLKIGGTTAEIHEECRLAASYAQKALRGGFLVEQSRQYLKVLSSLAGR